MGGKLELVDGNSDFAAYLDQITILDLYKKIGAFKRLDFQGMNSRTIMDAVYGVLMGPDGSFRLPVATSIIPAGTILYRARSLRKEDTSRPPSDVSKWTDIWEPPPEYAFAGRLNENSEPLLYTALVDQTVAIKEARIKAGVRFAMIRYVVLTEFKSSVLQWNADSTLSSANQQKMEKILSFLNEIMSSSLTSRGAYKVTAALTKDLGDYPEGEGWQYPSVASPGGINLCLKPDFAHKRLLPTGVAVLEWQPDGQRILFKTDHLIATDVGSQKLSPYEVTSSEGEQILAGFMAAPSLV